MSFLRDLINGVPDSPLAWIITILGAAFIIWMAVDAFRRGDYLWALFILFFVISAFLYYFLVYRPERASSGVRGFELPGAKQRQRVKELQAQIHHLDKAHHHSQLGDVYFEQGKLEKAESSYREAMARDAEDRDTRAHLGQCLLRLKRPDDALPLLDGVVKEEPDHDYGHTQMALAETYAALNRIDDAVHVWERVNEKHSYARARVQWAELLVRQGHSDRAQKLAAEVLAEDPHAPAYQRKRDKVWVRKAKALL